MDIREMEAGREFKEGLIKFWKICETAQLVDAFVRYMGSIGVKKWDGRRKNNRNTYLADGKGTNWNRATCYYYKDSTSYGNENIEIVLRKRAGDYLIISRQGTRAFEVDCQGVIHYDEKLLKQIIEEHKPLFTVLLAMEDKA